MQCELITRHFQNGEKRKKNERNKEEEEGCEREIDESENPKLNSYYVPTECKT